MGRTESPGHEEPQEVAPVEAAEEADPTDAPPALVLEQKRIRDYFAWRPLPWWIVFFGGIFLLTKLQIVYNDSPCAVLGTQGPVSMSEIKKAFRTLSMCTHPDRLRGRLKRPPTAAEERRGEIIFNRASAAKDELSRVLKGRADKRVPCYQGELEMAMWQFISQAGKAIGGLGIGDYMTIGMDLFWNIVTFEAGFLNTCLSLLWMAFLLRIVKQFLLYLWRLGIIRGVLAVVTTVIIGPIPTVLHFIFLPFFRFYTFATGVYRDLRPVVADAPDDEKQDDKKTDTEPAAPVLTSAMKAAAAANQELPHRGIRQRKKKETDEEKKAKNEALLAEAPEREHQEEIVVPGGRMPEGIFKCINMSFREPIKARQNAANAVQFDLLLILTKPIIPLIMLIASGQVWNGLFSSLFIGHALRKWVPQMGYEAHHLLCMFFGSMHTLLGVSASQVEDYANREGAKVLQLAWTWSFKDVLAIMHMCLLGSTVTAASSLGNEPSYASSFAAGIALRIALAQDSVKGQAVFQFASRKIEEKLKLAGVVIVASEEVVAYSGDGIGDCGGGPFRMMLGDGAQSLWASRILKVLLMVMPLMATCQWLLRTVHAGKMLGKRRKTTRFVQRLILFVLGLLQCFLFANLELNAGNGALGNFWVAMLFGCVGESLFCTYDVRGPVRQIVFLLLFLLI